MTSGNIGQHESHFRIDDLRTQVVTSDGSPPVGLRVHSLTAVATRDGFHALVDRLGPGNVSVTIEFTRPSPGPGVNVSVTASRWGLTAMMNLQLRLHPDTLGAVRVSLTPERGWHPADLVMLGIVRGQITAQASRRPEVTQTGSRSFVIDIQYLVHAVLSNGDIPVRWGVALSDIELAGEEIRFHFAPVPEVVDASMGK